MVIAVQRDSREMSPRRTKKERKTKTKKNNVINYKIILIIIIIHTQTYHDYYQHRKWNQKKKIQISTEDICIQFKLMSLEKA